MRVFFQTSFSLVLIIASLPTMVIQPARAADQTEDPTRLAAAAKEIFRAHCHECHNGQSATADVRVLDHAGLIQDKRIIPGQADQSLIYQLMTSTDDDVMPPSDRTPLTADEMSLVRRWITAGAAAFPADVSPADVPPEEKLESKEKEKKSVAKATTSKTDSIEALQAILNHVRKSSEDDRPFLRFFSLRHLVNSGVTEARLIQHRQALTKAINHLSRERDLVIPQPIDDVAGGTLYAIDIRQLGWHRTALKGQSKNSPAVELDFFDLALLEYPYGIAVEPTSLGKQIEREYLNVAKPVRPIVFVDADWFCSVALQPPLYHDFLQLPRTLAELETQLDVDVRSNLDTGIALRAGMIVSGVSRNNRAVERHPQRDGYYWKSHDFLTSLGHENILRDPIDFRPGGGEMIFRLPNGMQGYFVSDARGNRLDAAPTSIVVDKFASDRVVRNGLGCIRCHSRGIKDFRDVIHDIVETLPSRPGFDKQKALRMYPDRPTWEKMLGKDLAAFAEAMKKLDIDVDGTEPLSPVTSQYLDTTVTLESAASQLGITPEELLGCCRSPSFARMGLAPFAVGGVIRRDSFEENFDAIVRHLGLGVPIVPLDGNRLHEYTTAKSRDIVLATNKTNRFFEPGDELRILVKNSSGVIQHIELFGRGVQGEIVSLTDGVQSLAAGRTFTFPSLDQDAIEVRGGLGQETILLFHSRKSFPPAVVVSGKSMDDRLVHPFYQTDDSSSSTTDDEAASITKQTLVIETR
jgi:mono/diheme cytochrome c family protein